MNKKSVELINELIQQSVSIKKYAEQLLEKEINILTERPSATSWNVLECLEHLNRYGNYYLPKIKENLEKSSTAATENFRSSWLGNYFAKSMLSEDSKMKTF
ncbi:MAG: DinB family protein, partial [Bergeyella zoohelcum]|nr:DinB family protein [Bergeyella zoohelcum]